MVWQHTKQFEGDIRRLALDDYATMIRDGEIPRAPTHPSEAEQIQWTGQSGWETMRQALTFLKSADRGYMALRGEPLTNKRILDFGCGWGRMLHYLPWFTDHIYGCDPWDEALKLCAAHKVPGDIRQSDRIPERLPFDEAFDLIYAYSVMTHTSPRATLAILRAMRRSIAPDGLALVTICPVEIWSTASQGLSPDEINSRTERHARDGICHVPLQGPPDYGWTSTDLSWLRANAPEWRFERYDRSVDDAHQVLVFLSPA
jgi:SAM-dependent methyltransferase